MSVFKDVVEKLLDDIKAIHGALRGYVLLIDTKSDSCLDDLDKSFEEIILRGPDSEQSSRAINDNLDSILGRLADLGTRPNCGQFLLVGNAKADQSLGVPLRDALGIAEGQVWHPSFEAYIRYSQSLANITHQAGIPPKDLSGRDTSVGVAAFWESQLTLPLDIQAAPLLFYAQRTGNDQSGTPEQGDYPILRERLSQNFISLRNDLHKQLLALENRRRVLLNILHLAIPSEMEASPGLTALLAGSDGVISAYTIKAADLHRAIIEEVDYANTKAKFNALRSMLMNVIGSAPHPESEAYLKNMLDRLEILKEILEAERPPMSISSSIDAIRTQLDQMGSE
jgi:hypothetical protein